MKILYATVRDPTRLTSWSGTPFHISTSLKRSYPDVEVVFRACQGGREADGAVISGDVMRRLTHTHIDIILTDHSGIVANLECEQPIVLWVDSCFSAVHEYYEYYSNLSSKRVAALHMREQSSLDRCALAVFASEWAADHAIRHYRIEPRRVAVVPLGANVPSSRLELDPAEMLESRPRDRCVLLFVGVDWVRKGGDIALDIARRLHDAGLPISFIIAGCEPALDQRLPAFVEVTGFLDKGTAAGRAEWNRIFGQAHFLLLPTRAECFGIVFAEASAFAVPSVASRTGGVPTAVRDGVSGRLFELDAPIDSYCNYIRDLWYDRERYERLAKSAYRDYQTRLNWNACIASLATLMRQVVR
jgi:glycosyltransferase involved in cell wall biosynthesis